MRGRGRVQQPTWRKQKGGLERTVFWEARDIGPIPISVIWCLTEGKSLSVSHVFFSCFFLLAYWTFESTAPNTIETKGLAGAAIVGSHDDSVSAVFQLCNICHSLPIPIWRWQLGFLTCIVWSKNVNFADLESFTIVNSLASILDSDNSV